ncbi:sulfurtransferase [Propionivibrio limicola]|uniref:sulfurtransferase n=1 Tax=Propionivibrio limicola TaxID=167645 RepID=UPI001B87C566|nr:sulfurtransferase [Propionivibrio limicola]
MTQEFTTLVSSEVLSTHMDDPEWRVFDCRHQLSDVTYGEKAYAQGRIPGAFFTHLDRDLSGPMNGKNGRHPLPEVQLLAKKLGAAGVSRKTQVVVYDDDGGMYAVRLWWLLRWLGHDRVALLDGGINQWVKDGGRLATDEPAAEPAVFEIEQRNWGVTADEVLNNLNDAAFFLVDARGPDRFRGENETLDPVGGHIPGARNYFFRNNLDADGCFRSAAELRHAYLGLLAGVEPAQVVMQCGSGVTACHNLLAMEIAGLRGARLYAGSWSEWCADSSRPIEC